MDENVSGARPPAGPSQGQISSREVAQYIGAMSAEMSAMAHASGLRRLAAGLRVIRALCEEELGEPG